MQSVLVAAGIIVFTIWFAGFCLMLFAKSESRLLLIGRLFFYFGILVLALFAAAVLIDACQISGFESGPSLF